MADEKNRPEIAQLVAEHHQAAYRYAYRLTGSVHDAEDLTQQVFLVAQQKLGDLRKIENAKAWLFAILRNCFLKSVQRRQPVLAIDLPLTMELVEESGDAEEVDRDRVQQALDRLPEASRVVLVMFYFEDCSYREIAERLEMPIGTVMSRLARAKGFLRSVLLEPDRGHGKRPSAVTSERR